MQNFIYLILFIAIDAAIYFTFSTYSIVKKRSSKIYVVLSILLFFVLHTKSIRIEFLMHGEKFSVLANSVIVLLVANFIIARSNWILYNPAINHRFMTIFRNVIINMPYVIFCIVQGIIIYN